jgi:hypothetical protein
MGYGRRAARFFAGFFYVSMMTVGGALFFVREKCRAGEEGNRLLLLLFGLPGGWPESSLFLENGAGRNIADARAVPVLSAPLIQRR